MLLSHSLLCTHYILRSTYSQLLLLPDLFFFSSALRKRNTYSLTKIYAHMLAENKVNRLESIFLPMGILQIALHTYYQYHIYSNSQRRNKIKVCIVFFSTSGDGCCFDHIRTPSFTHKLFLVVDFFFSCRFGRILFSYNSCWYLQYQFPFTPGSFVFLHQANICLELSIVYLARDITLETSKQQQREEKYIFFSAQARARYN